MAMTNDDYDVFFKHDNDKNEVLLLIKMTKKIRNKFTVHNK